MGLREVKGKQDLKIGIIRLGAVGDIIRTIPVLPFIKQQYPDAKLYWIAEKWASNILEEHPYLTELITIPRKRWSRLLKRIYGIPVVLYELRKLIAHIKSREFDIVLDFHGLFKSGLLSKLSGSTVRIGYSKKYCKEYNHWFNNVQVDATGVYITRVEKNFNLLRPLVEDVDISEDLDAHIYISDKDKCVVDDFFSEQTLTGRRVVAVNCAVSAYKAYKEWPLDYYVALIKKIMAAEPETVCMLTWGPGELDKVNYIKEHCDNKAVILAPKTTLKQLAYLITKFAVFITGDTGPMHLASTMGTPTLAIFGPSDPIINAPWGRQHQIAWKNVECNPCRDRHCKKLICVKELTPDKVFEIYQKMDGAGD